MGEIIDITPLVSANKARVEAARRFNEAVAGIRVEGDQDYETETHRLIVKNGKIRLIRKHSSETSPQDIIA
jgi:hypothetical protein